MDSTIISYSPRLVRVADDRGHVLGAAVHWRDADGTLLWAGEVIPSEGSGPDCWASPTPPDLLLTKEGLAGLEAAAVEAAEGRSGDDPLDIPCRCDCGCDAPATTTDDMGETVCAACAVYSLRPDGTVMCSRETDGGERCPTCHERIDWGDVLTAPWHTGRPNYRLGTCACPARDWRSEHRGAWTHPTYSYGRPDLAD